MVNNKSIEAAMNNHGPDAKSYCLGSEHTGSPESRMNMRNAMKTDAVDKYKAMKLIKENAMM